jgi:hypothetical protein
MYYFCKLLFLLDFIAAFNIAPIANSIGTIFHHVANSAKPIGQLVPPPVMKPPVVLTATTKSVAAGISNCASNCMLTLGTKGFMLATVKNMDESIPIMKSIAKGATETILDNPRLVLKVAATHSVPNLFKAVFQRITKLIQIIKRMTIAAPKIPPTLIADKTLSPTAQQALLDSITKGLSEVGKGVESINLAILMQANIATINFASKNTIALDQAKQMGSRIMMTALTDPKSKNNLLHISTEIQNQIRKDHPEAMKKLDNAKLQGTIEAIGEKVLQSQKALIIQITKLAINLLLKRHVQSRRFKRDFDLEEFRQLTIEAIKEFDEVALMIKKLE